MRHANPSTLLISFCLVAATAHPARSADASASTQPAPPDDAKRLADLTARVAESRERKLAALEDMKRKLRELSQPGAETKVADAKALEAEKKLLLVRRRLADLEADRARRAFDLYWYERDLTPAQRNEIVQLGPEDRDALLDGRSVAQKLAVPLPPAKFTAAPAETVLKYVAIESGVRVVGDWPSLAAVGMQRRTPVGVEIGRFNRPAIDTLRSVVDSLSGGKATIDLTKPGAVVVTTAAGAKLWAEADAKLAARVMDARSWAALAVPLEPVNLAQVPLVDALTAGMPSGESPPLVVDWRGLAEAGVTPRTPVNLLIGAHTLGQRLAVLAEAMDERPAVKKVRGIRFDLHTTGQIVLSTNEGFGRVTAGFNRVMAAATTDDARDVLLRHVPEAAFDGATLGDAVDFLHDLTKLDVRADWDSLAACGLTPKSVATVRASDVPLAFVLAMLMDPPTGRPAVEWEVADGHIVARGPTARK